MPGASSFWAAQERRFVFRLSVSPPPTTLERQDEDFVVRLHGGPHALGRFGAWPDCRAPESRATAPRGRANGSPKAVAVDRSRGFPTADRSLQAVPRKI